MKPLEMKTVIIKLLQNNSETDILECINMKRKGTIMTKGNRKYKKIK